MVRKRGSAATELPSPPPQNVRRSSRSGRGTGGRDVQLDELGDILVSSTRKRKPKFSPDDSSLSANPRAPPPKGKRRKKVFCLLSADPVTHSNLSAFRCGAPRPRIVPRPRNRRPRCHHRRTHPCSRRWNPHHHRCNCWHSNRHTLFSLRSTRVLASLPRRSRRPWTLLPLKHLICKI